MMRAVIVDDEFHAREELERLLVETGQFQIAAKCTNAMEALAAIRKEKPDVLFLDIHMPVVGGFELLSMIDQELMPAVVFVTAHDDFAVQAFDENAIDYLLKPVEKERLAKTVERLGRLLSEGARPSYSSPELKRIPCVGSHSIKLVPIPEIEYVKSGPAGVYVVTPRGEFFTELTLSVLEAKASLLRCHKQYLVNVDQIDEIGLAEKSLAVIRTKSGAAVPVSRRYLARLRTLLGL